MAAAKINLTIEKGSKYFKTFVWRNKSKQPISLTGLSARMQIRETLESTAFEVELTTTNGRIVLEDNSEVGRIDLILGATITDAIGIQLGVFDLELYDESDTDEVVRLMEGVISITDGVTR